MIHFTLRDKKIGLFGDMEDGNIKLKKTRAKINLDDASTSFTFTINDATLKYYR